MKPYGSRYAGKWGALPAVYAALWLGLALGAADARAAGQRYALLVGVGEYKDTAIQPELQGPVNDVDALHRMLVRRWGFRADHITTLTNADATKQRILDAIEALTAKVSKDDHVLIYYSGHGISAKAPGAEQYDLPYTTGAILPFDMPITGASVERQRNGLIIGKSDLRPRLARLDAKAGDVFVVFDSCYSAKAVRGLRAAGPTPWSLPARSPPGVHVAQGGGVEVKGNRWDEEEEEEAPAAGGEDYPYRNIFFLSAAGAAEKARDIFRANLRKFPTLDGKPHGAFSDTFLRVLSGDIDADIDGNGRLTYGELYRGVRDFMLEQRDYGHTPQTLPKSSLERGGLAQRVAFGTGKATAPAPTPTPGPSTALRVFVLGDDWPELRKALTRLPGVEWDPTHPRMVVQRKDKSAEITDGAGFLVARLSASNPARLTRAVVDRMRGQLVYERLKGLGAESRGFNLMLELKDGKDGVKARIGERINFMVSAERPAYLLLLDYDPNGKVQVLYPGDASEVRLHRAGEVFYFPGADACDMIDVVAPVGTDQLLLLAFERRSPLLARLAGAVDLDIHAPSMDALGDLIKAQKGRLGSVALPFVVMEQGGEPPVKPPCLR